MFMKIYLMKDLIVTFDNMTKSYADEINFDTI